MSGGPSRRQLLTGIAGGVAGFLLPLPALARPAPPRRALSFHNLHTNENLAVTYYADGRYDRHALTKIDVILRDHRTGDVQPIDPKLIELLFDLRHQMGSDAPFHIISGYRSPRTNGKLASKSKGVAKKSLHMRGLAIDVRLPDRRLKDVRKTAIAMRRGGVGYYGKSGFVHLDTGRVRYW
ncbi:MAG: DUF882 domain-containing protein [Alphaproteobacteria bacterium]